MRKKIFTKKADAEAVTEGRDLRGKTIVITGINSGIGHETMRVLALRGAHIIACARSMEKAQKACDSVIGKTTPVVCELSDMASVKNCAETIQALKIPIDVIICNAGIMALPTPQVKDGLELQFLTNHMGHFLLVYSLQEQLKSADKARIVMLSSAGHMAASKHGIDFDNLDAAKSYGAWQFYGQAKLANLLTAIAFNRHLGEAGVTANAIHPGVINTNLGRDVGGLIGIAMKTALVRRLLDMSIAKSIPQGASTSCFVATHPSLDGIGGRYFANNSEAKPTKLGRDEELAEKLWAYSVDYLAPYIKVA
ncbi:SDR family oxidoreductase [Zhongshania sp.]|jgi:NAD(P)-dependent dehydrogenase (short-subunit alcohol dehydrogenase family)|uniref:SDR family oxidoreductase n=1 Tax=Zhongshania sp. TaxID=1971902 RepID=UPI0039E50174